MCVPTGTWPGGARSLTGTIRVAALFPNPGNILRPGQFARIRALRQVKQGALLVPQRYPQMVVRAEGMYLWNDRGDKIIDASSGLFCVSAGHGRKEIAEAVGRQMAELDFVAPFLRGHMVDNPETVATAIRIGKPARGEQALLFLNRRGYAPVLACPPCGWISRCQRCAANLVLHLADQRLRCHHCGFEARVPRACPDCGNLDLAPLGRGTQRLEAALRERFPEAHITLLTPEKLRDLWTLHPAVDEVIGIDAGDTVFSVSRKLRAGRFHPYCAEAAAR